MTALRPADGALSIFAAAVEEPDRLALLAGDEAFTFARLADRVAGVCAWLSDHHDASSHLAVVAERRFETLLLTYAAIELGRTLVPLHPRWSEGERRRFAADLGLSGWLLPEQVAAEATAAPAGHREHQATRHLAVLPTSGSSGRAKAVALSRSAFAAAAAAHGQHLGWCEEDRWLLSLPLAHVGGLSVVIRCLAARRAVVLPPPGEGFSAAQIVRQIENGRVSLLSVVPAMVDRLLGLGAPPPASLRAMLVGGAPVPPALLAAARDAGWPALATYGLTEACAQVATQPLCDLEEAGPPRRGAPLLPGFEARLDPGGVLFLRGPSLMSGYLAGHSADGPDAEGWLRTGDRALFTGDGRLHVLGRHDRTIITGGENVHPSEVECALLELPSVAAACVVGVDDARWGQAVAAAIVPAGGELTFRQGDLVDEIRDALAGRLADFKMPRRIRAVEQLPSTNTGKIDAEAVKKLF